METASGTIAAGVRAPAVVSGHQRAERVDDDLLRDGTGVVQCGGVHHVDADVEFTVRRSRLAAAVDLAGDPCRLLERARANQQVSDLLVRAVPKPLPCTTG